MARAAIYARFSTDRQNESSIEEQGQRLHSIRQRAEVDVVTVYDDKGISGANRKRAVAAKGIKKIAAR
jgi:site-specific DNA recombinase